MIKFKRLENGQGLDLPSYETEEAAGMDIRSAEYLTLLPQKHEIVSTGFAVQIPKGYEIQVRPRSGLAAKYGITVLNSPGTIDSDYRGEINIILINHSESYYYIDRGERIAQLVLAKVEKLDCVEVGELSDTKRGEGGLGSTGK